MVVVRDISVETIGSIRWITLDRPERRNALSMPMLEALAESITLPPSGKERVILLAAEGMAFCSGLDLTTRRKEGTPLGGSPIEAVLEALDHSILPTVASVNGAAIAGGCELALNCDIIVANRTAFFSMPLTRIGTAPTWDLVVRLVDRVGASIARELLLVGDPVSADRLAGCGVVRVVDQTEKNEAARQVAMGIAEGAPLAVRAVRAAFTLQSKRSVVVDHLAVDQLVQAARQSADAREGVAARLERRRPKFKGL